MKTTEVWPQPAGVIPQTTSAKSQVSIAPPPLRLCYCFQRLAGFTSPLLARLPLQNLITTMLLPAPGFAGSPSSVFQSGFWG
jgi:hypothetical protein